MEPNEAQTELVAARISVGMKERLAEALKRTRVSQADLIRSMLQTFCDEVETRGKITFPLRLSHDTAFLPRPGAPVPDAPGEAVPGFVPGAPTRHVAPAKAVPAPSTINALPAPAQKSGGGGTLTVPTR